MLASDISAILGLAETDPRLEDQFRNFGVADYPKIHDSQATVDVTTTGIQDWIGNNSVGIEFGFGDEAAFIGLDASDSGSGQRILTEIYFYCHHPAVRPYPWQLPFGLNLCDDRQVVRAKLAKLEPTRRSYVFDTWELDAFRMTISYANGGTCIGFIICMMRYEPSLPFEQGLASLPMIKTVIALFGKRIDDQTLRSIFVSFGLDRQLRSDSEELVDFRSTYGFDLRFSTLKPSMSVRVLSQIMCYRDREFDARGWRGDLPFGITFDDSPETLDIKIGQPPHDRVDEDFTGFAVWHFSAYSLCIYYSIMENMVLRVRILAPGVWARYEID